LAIAEKEIPGTESIDCLATVLLVDDLFSRISLRFSGNKCRPVGEEAKNRRKFLPALISR